MQKHIIKLLLLIIAFTFALSANYIFAVWTGPTQAPPGGNTPTPVHIGAVDQVKYAGLALNYLAVFGASYFEGNVGIGTMSPTEKLDVVEGNVRISNLPNCNSLATDSNGKIICNVVPPPPPITCVSGSKDFLTPLEFSLVVSDDMKGFKFNFTIKG